MNKKTLEELAQSLDHNCGSLGLNQLTINNINTELGRLSLTVEETDKSDLVAMGLTFRDMEHSIQILADLLHYTTKNLSNNLEETKKIKEAFFDKTVRKNGGNE